MKNLLLLVLSLIVTVVHAQEPAPENPDYSNPSVLILGGVAHIGDGEVIENSAIGIDEGHLKFVKNQLVYRIDVSKFDSVIHLNGQHVYPGFIALNNELGLREIEAVRATNDYDDVGSINPNVRSLIAFNTDSKIIPTTRVNGVLMTQVTPKGGLISGTSSIVDLAGWNWEEAAVHADDGVHLRWPSRFKNSGWWAAPGKTKRNDKVKEQKQELRLFFQESRAYAYDTNKAEINLKMEAMQGLFTGSKRLYVHANYAKDLLEIGQFKKDFDIANLVVVGGYDAYLVPEVFKDLAIPIILERPHHLPSRPDDDIFLPYKLPGILDAMGITVAIDPSGQMEGIQVRNLPFTAGTARSYGLEDEKAVQAITLNAAKIVGIDENYGSLMPGKRATLFVSEGDALDARSNKVLFALVDGVFVDLQNHQEEKYQKYKDRYRKQGLIQD